MEETPKEVPEDLGTVTVGLGAEQKVFPILDYVQAQYTDNRLITITGIEGSTLISIENPVSSGRTPQQTLNLSQESLMGLLLTTLLYYSAKEIDLLELAIASAKNDQINYAYSQNLSGKFPFQAPEDRTTTDEPR